MILIPHYSQHPYYWDPGLHLLYVGDERRLAPFRAAVREVVREGMVVADIGTGTGPLARYAAEAGSRKVYAIEQHAEILRFAERFNRTEGVQDVIELIRGDARRVDLGEKVDVIVSELIGGVGNDEAMSAILEDSRTRFLKPGGTMIPRSVDVFVCPIEARLAHAQVPSVYNDDPIVGSHRGFAPFSTYYQILGLPPKSLVAKPALLDAIDLLQRTALEYERDFSFLCTVESTISGFAVWFRAALSDSVVLDTSPWAPPTCWGQAFFPIRDPLKVEAGDTIELTFRAAVPPGSDRPLYRWHGRATRRGITLGNFEQEQTSQAILVPPSADNTRMAGIASVRAGLSRLRAS